MEEIKIEECRHPKLKFDSFTDKPGVPAQQTFSFLRCIDCGEIFPLSPAKHEKSLDKLAAIEQLLKDIKQHLLEINRKTE
jgi:hypothetical protein